MESKRRPPTLDEFRAQTEAEVRLAVRDAAERFFAGAPPERPAKRTPKPPKEQTPLLPGIAIQSYRRKGDA
jgi:hypothetical protein